MIRLPILAFGKAVYEGENINSNVTNEVSNNYQSQPTYQPNVGSVHSVMDNPQVSTFQSEIQLNIGPNNQSNLNVEQSQYSFNNIQPNPFGQ